MIMMMRTHTRIARVIYCVVGGIRAVVIMTELCVWLTVRSERGHHLGGVAHTQWNVLSGVKLDPRRCHRTIIRQRELKVRDGRHECHTGRDGGGIGAWAVASELHKDWDRPQLRGAISLRCWGAVGEKPLLTEGEHDVTVAVCCAHTYAPTHARTHARGHGRSCQHFTLASLQQHTAHSAQGSTESGRYMTW